MQFLYGVHSPMVQCGFSFAYLLDTDRAVLAWRVNDQPRFGKVANVVEYHAFRAPNPVPNFL